MIRLMLPFIIFFVAILTATPFLAKHQGYILIALGHYTIELSIISGCILLLLSYALIWLVVKVGQFFCTLPRRTRQFCQQHRVQKSLKDYQQGILAFICHDYKVASKLLNRGLRYSPFPLLHYLQSAQTAHAQNQTEKRDILLQQAYAGYTNHLEAITIFHAQMLIDEGEFEAALAIIEQRKKQLTDSNYSFSVETLRLKIFLALKDWPAVLESISYLRQNKDEHAHNLDNIACQAHQYCMQNLMKEQDIQSLIKYWHTIPKNLRKDKMLSNTFYRMLAISDAFPDHQDEIYRYLQRYTSIDVLKALTQVRPAFYPDVIALLQKGLVKDPNNPQFLATIGTLFYKKGELKQAQIHLEQSVAIAPEPSNYYLLGQMMEHMHLQEKAREYYRKGLDIQLNNADNNQQHLVSDT